jgi:hypothetical protein
MWWADGFYSSFTRIRPKEGTMTTTATPRNISKTEARELTTRAKYLENWRDAYADFETSDAKLDSPESNQLAAKRDKAVRMLERVTEKLVKRGYSTTSGHFDGELIPPTEEPEPEAATPAKPKKATPKKATFASTAAAREKAATKVGENVARVLRSDSPVRLPVVEEAIALDLIEAGTFDPIRKQIIAVGQPMFLSHGLILGVSSPAKQQMPNPRWAGKQTIGRIARQVKDAAPRKDAVDTAIADPECDQGRPLTDSEAMEVEREVAKSETA